MKFKEYYHLINEIHYQDYYAKSFEEFHKKWKSQKNNSDLYVNFTNNSGDTLHRKGFDDPNHSDPIGVYCYPLKYVIDHPSDIWYGSNAQYVRVIKNNTPYKNTLYLDAMGYSEARNTLYYMGLSDSYLDLAAKRLPEKNKGVTKWGKLFMAAFQIDWENPPKKI